MIPQVKADPVDDTDIKLKNDSNALKNEIANTNLYGTEAIKN